MGKPAVTRRFAIREPRYPSPMNPNRLRRVIFLSDDIDPGNCICGANRRHRRNPFTFHKQKPTFMGPALTDPVDRTSWLTSRRHYLGWRPLRFFKAWAFGHWNVFGKA